jgi:uncharacterized RDD family membrane protein YckC
MKSEEIAELMTKGKEDGLQLFVVANAIYKISIALVAIIGFAGAILFFVALSNAGFGPALAVAIATATICAVGYALTVLGSNGAKVLVHLLFSNLAILEKMKE